MEETYCAKKNNQPLMTDYNNSLLQKVFSTTTRISLKGADILAEVLLHPCWTAVPGCSFRLLSELTQATRA